MIKIHGDYQFNDNFQSFGSVYLSTPLDLPPTDCPNYYKSFVVGYETFDKFRKCKNFRVLASFDCINSESISYVKKLKQNCPRKILVYRIGVTISFCSDVFK